jgi:outer membrane protein
MTPWNSSKPVENPLDTFSAGASLGVSQKIYDGGKNAIQKALNAISSESTRKDALTEIFNVLDSADNAYYAVLEAAAALEAEESSLSSSVTSLAIAETRFSGGMIHSGDYLKALAEKESRENSRNQSRRNLSLAVIKLKTLTGIDHITTVEPIQFAAYENLINRLGTISDSEVEALYGHLLDLLMPGNPTLARSRLAMERSKINLKQSKTSYLPSLGASVSAGLNYSPANGFDMSGEGRVSFSASIPIDFWVLNNNIAKSKIALDSTALDCLNTEIQTETDIYSALLNLLTYSGSYLSSRRSLEYAERHFEYIAERYRLNQSSISEYIDASTSLINSRNSHIRASYSFLQGFSRLRSLGAIDDDERLISILLR